MLLPGGRRERFLATVFVAIALSLLLMLVAMLAVCLSEMIVVLLGPGAQSLGTRIHSAWLACILVPWLCALRSCRPGTLPIGNILRGGLYGIATVTPVFLCLPGYRPVRVIILAVIAVSGWAVFLRFLQRLCTRGDLLGPKPLKGGWA